MDWLTSPQFLPPLTSESVTLAPCQQSVVLLCVVILLKYLLAKLSPQQPLRAFQFYCQLLANKVNNPKRSHQQQAIAGIVALFVTLIPIAIILWLFADFIQLIILWHGVLLFLAIDGPELPQTSNQISKALNEQNNYAAKQALAPLVLRETSVLSPLGISKACIEMLLLRTVQQLFTVGFYFLTVGPLAALMVRLLLEMHYSWNIKQQRSHFFGSGVYMLVQFLQWLPVRLFSGVLQLFNLGQHLPLFWRQSKSQWLRLNNNIVIAQFAFTLGIRLGGVAIYNKEKLRKQSFNDHARQPEISDIKHANAKLRQFILIWLGMLVIASAVL